MLDGSAVSLVALVLGTYLTVISLASYAVKERAFVSQAVIAVLVGVAVGPKGFGWIIPLEWTSGSDISRDNITYEFTRIVLGIQVLFSGINLPQSYLLKQWRSLSVVLMPLMIAMWLISSTLVYVIVPGLSWLESLVVGAAITPTDPVLCASVVRGRFAENHVPPHLRDLLTAEAGANDGLAFPFIALALYLCKREEQGWNHGEVIKEWFTGAILYEFFLSVLIGALLGFIARRLLKKAHVLKIIDHESFLAYNLGLTLLVLGVVGVIESDDLLACFIAGNSFTFDGFFLEETSDSSFQDVIDNLLDSTVFIYVGAILPWDDWANASLNLPAPRLTLLVVAVLLLRRLPAAWLLHYYIPDLKTVRESLFFGWFGPMGIGAVYYVQTALQDLDSGREYLRETIKPIVFAVIIGSVIVHGITIPVVLLGTRLGGARILEDANERTPLLLDINGDPSPAQPKDLENQAQRDDTSSVYEEGNQVIVDEEGGSRHDKHK